MGLFGSLVGANVQLKFGPVIATVQVASLGPFSQTNKLCTVPGPFADFLVRACEIKGRVDA